MKKIIYSLLTASLIASAALSCTDDRNNFMVGDSFGFVNNIDIEGSEPYLPFATVSLLNEEYKVGIYKSGKGMSAATVALNVSEVALAEYNELNGTDYVVVPSGMYELSSSRITFAQNETVKFLDITWNASELYALDHTRSYAIPVVMTAVDDALDVAPDRSVLIVSPTLTSVSLVAPAALPMSPSAARQTKSYEGVISVNNPVNGMDIVVNYSIDESLVEAYNAANGTDYVAPPAGMASLAATSSTIAAGESATGFEVRIISENLFDGNRLKQVYNEKYLLPVRVTSLSSEFISVSGGVVYLPIDLNKQLMGPWTILEGADLCLANDPVPEPYDVSIFSADKLFNGDYSIYNDWCSYWNTKNPFPLAFVADMGETRVFTMFKIADSNNYQGSVRDYEIYTAETYDGASTQWNLVASGQRGYDWTGTWGTIYDYPVQNMIAGRYLKFVIVKHARAESAWTGDYVNGRCKLAEVFGMGF